MNYRKVYATNATDASYPARIATVTEPASSGVILLPGAAQGNARLYGRARFVFFGAGSDNNTFNARIIGWAKTTETSTGLWIPTPLWDGLCTLSTSVGVAGTDVIDTDRFVDTIATTAGYGADGVTCQPVSTQSNTPGSLLLDLASFDKLEVIFFRVTSTNCNALVQFLPPSQATS